MFISRIELQNWKNFKSTEAALSRRTFLIGPNASGKSNLLDAFRFLHDLAEDGLKQAVDDRGGVSSIRCLAARKSPNIAIEVVLSRAGGDPQWRYRIEFNQDSQRTPQVRKEIVQDLKSEAPPLVDRPNDDDREDEMLLTQTALEQIFANREFREVTKFFESIWYQHVIPQAVRDPQEFSPSPVKNDPFGRDILQRIWDKRQRTRRARLRRISSVLQEAVPQLKDLEVEMDDQGKPHLIGRFEIGDLTMHGKMKPSFQTARCVSSASCGQCLREKALFFSKNPNYHFTLKLYANFHNYLLSFRRKFVA